jgi:uncharacterized protein (TIGR02996 family)
MTDKDRLDSLVAYRHGRIIFNRTCYLFHKVPEGKGRPYLVKVSSEEQAFLTTIYKDKHHGTTAILVYADWLEEHDFVAAAHDIRQRVAMAQRTFEIEMSKKPPRPGTKAAYRAEARTIRAKVQAGGELTIKEEDRLDELWRLLNPERVSRREEEMDDDEYDSAEVDREQVRKERITKRTRKVFA